MQPSAELSEEFVRALVELGEQLSHAGVGVCFSTG